MKWILLICLTSPVFAATKAAQVHMLRGKAWTVNKKKKSALKKGDWVYQGSNIKTAKRSFVRLRFPDKSSMNLGPSSEMKIEKFSKKKAGIVSLIGGQLRAKVTKDVLRRSQKSKLFLKTKTAAMGIRGTDFQVTYGRSSGVTSLVTFEGAVAMAQIDKDHPDPGNNSAALENMVSGQSSVTVTQGNYAGASPKYQRATIPQKISPTQFSSLKSNSTFRASTQREHKTYKSPVPPGLSSKTVANDNAVVREQVTNTVGVEAIEKIEEKAEAEAEAETSVKVDAPPVEGINNPETGEFAPRAGGFIHPELGYIEPPKDASFDANSGTYNIPSNMGSVDPNTGQFINPEHFKLTSDGKYVATDSAGRQANQLAANSTTSGTRAPSNTIGAPPPPPPIIHTEAHAPEEPPKDQDGNYVLGVGEVMSPEQFQELQSADPAALEATFADSSSSEFAEELEETLDEFNDFGDFEEITEGTESLINVQFQVNVI